MQHEYSIAYKHVLLRPICIDDLENMRMWRNDTDLTKHLRKLNPITPEMQLKWFENDNLDQSCYTFAIEETKSLKRLVGSASLYNFDGENLECGRIVIGDKDAHGKGIGFLAITLLLWFGFTKLDVNKIDAVVHEDNLAAIKNNTKAGFITTGKHPYEHGGNELEIVVDKGTFFSLHDFLDEITIRRAG